MASELRFFTQTLGFEDEFQTLDLELVTEDACIKGNVNRGHVSRCRHIAQ